MTEREKASRARQRLREAARKHDTLLEALVSERGPLLRGTFHLGHTRCGKDNCKCAQGELHTTAVLVVSDRGVRRTFYLRGAERPEVQRRAERYRRFRKTRAELRKLNGEVLGAADELLEALLEPHTPQRDDRDGGNARRSKKRQRKVT
ncbi:hypothetical protein H8D79_01515 [PVC group bacterium]|nr:hypothetical protein [PVC group bacterium]